MHRIQISDQAHRSLKIEAAKTGRQMREIASEIIAKGTKK